MAGRFVRASKYRHVFGKPTKREATYDNLHISRNAWDTNLVKVNPEYLSVNWEASGGGAFAVIPLNEKGRLPEQIPLFRGHTAPVLDTDWNPFNDHIIASGSDDSKVFIWRVPTDFTLHTDTDEPSDIAPIAKLSGHSRKVGQVLFSPSASNILASASGDYTIKIWDIEPSKACLTLKHGDIVQSLSWSANGNLLVTTSRDKKLRIWDVRQERAAHEVPGHSGAKNSRAVWMGEHDRVVTTGFSKMSDRQMALWDIGNPAAGPIGGFTTLDSISGVCMPFWDDGTQCLYLAGKGDGNIRYFEYENDTFQFLSEYKSADPQRGIAFLPRRGLDVHENEVMRAYKTVNDSYIEPISFVVPRRAEVFQSDIYPPATGLKPGLSAESWLAGEDALPAKISLESVYDGIGHVEVASDYKPAQDAPAPKVAPSPAAATPKFKESEPAPASTPVASRGPPPSMKDQKGSIAAMADKFADNDDDSEDGDEDDETSSFEEVARPVQRVASTAATTAASAAKAVPAAVSSVVSKVAEAVTPNFTPSPAPGATSTASALKPASAPAQKAGPPASSSLPPTPTQAAPAPTAGATSGVASTSAVAAGSGVEASLAQITALLQAQNEQLRSQNAIIERLTREVEVLKSRVGQGQGREPAGAEGRGNGAGGNKEEGEKSARIRELELEVESLRSQ